MARALVAAAAVATSLLAVSGADGATTPQTPKPGGTVYVVWTGVGEPPCLNPLVSPCANTNGQPAPVGAVLEGAFKQGPDFAWHPRLVSGVDVNTRQPFTLTYHIRPEARWSDGVPVTASDFVFTYHALLEYPAPGSEENRYRVRIRTVRALDARTLRLVLRGKFAFWRGFFSVVLPRHALRGADLARIWTTKIDNPKTGEPIGSGPFQPTRRSRRTCR